MRKLPQNVLVSHSLVKIFLVSFAWISKRDGKERKREKIASMKKHAILLKDNRYDSRSVRESWQSFENRPRRNRIV